MAFNAYLLLTSV